MWKSQKLYVTIQHTSPQCEHRKDYFDLYDRPGKFSIRKKYDHATLQSQRFTGFQSHTRWKHWWSSSKDFMGRNPVTSNKLLSKCGVYSRRSNETCDQFGHITFESVHLQGVGLCHGNACQINMVMRRNRIVAFKRGLRLIFFVKFVSEPSPPVILGRDIGPSGVSPIQRSRWKFAFSPLKHV